MLTNQNVEKLTTMAQDFLQYRYKMFLVHGKRDADWAYYEGACDMIHAFGGEWRRHYRGKDNSDVEENNIDNYSHTVWFPDKEKCNRLNENAWKD